MSEMDKYYQILGLNPGASEKEIVEAYKVLVKVWHPDRFPDDPNIQKIATEKIKEIDKAFKQLLIWAGGSPEKVKEIPEPKLEVRTEPLGTKGNIVIQTEPEGAVIAINGELVGISPYEGVELSSGYYKVRATLQKYEIWEKDVYVKAVAKQEVFAKLKLKEPESGQLWKDPYTEMEFVYVKGGSFEMGDTFGDGKSDEQPVHKVFLDDFYIGKYQVTQGQWEKVMGNNPSYYSVEGNDYPVESVSWEDAQDYIRTLKQKTGKSYRLPTEAEWEYAARDRGKKEKWSGTSSENSAEVYVWFKDNSDNKTHPVGQKKANGLGLHDMSGNIWEWVQDWYMESYSKVSKDNNPVNSSRGDAKIIRGGSWSDNLKDLRNSNRESMATYKKSVVVGFRLVLPAQAEQPFKREKEQPITSEDKTHSTSQLSSHEPLYEPSPKVLLSKDLKPGIEQTVVSSHIVEYAGFWKRFAAFVVDCILVFIATFIVCIVCFVFGLSINISGADVDQVKAVVYILGFFICWLYYAVMESSSRQATLGKMALGIVVTGNKGGRISFGRATGRHFAKIISGLILLIGYIMAGFTEKKQALHDMIAECLVVVKK